MQEILVNPNELLPTAEGVVTEDITKLIEQARFDEIPNLEVLEIPEDNPLRIAFEARYVILRGNNIRRAAQTHNMLLRANLIEETDPDYETLLSSALQGAGFYYEGHF